MRWFPLPLPSISVLVPVYNNECYLEECLTSIAAQTLKSIEIILINDGSTSEGTIRILEDFSKSASNVRLVHKPNTGYGHSLNMGIDLAKGEFIGIVESDDFIHPRMFEILYRLAKNTRVDCVKTDFAYFIDYEKRRIYSRGRIHKDSSIYNHVVHNGPDGNIFKSLSLNQTGIYKKAFLRQNNIRFNESAGASFQDNGFFFQIMMNVSNLYFCDIPLYFLRRDNVNSSVFCRSKEAVIFDEYKFIEEIIQRNGPNATQFYPFFVWKKFTSYFFNLCRVDDQYKEEFIIRFAEEFRHHQIDGQLDLSFFNASQKLDLQEIMDKPNEFLSSNLERLQPAKYLERQKRQIDSSASDAKEWERYPDKFFRIPPAKIPPFSLKHRLISFLSCIIESISKSNSGTS